MLMPVSLRSLRYTGLRPSTIKAYAKACRKFFLFLRARHLRLPSTYDEWDARICSHLDEMWREGEPLAYAGHLMSALKRLHPASRGHLWTAKQFYAKWRSTHKVRRAKPMPKSILDAAAAAAFLTGRQDLGLLLLCSFYGLLRPNEAGLMRAKDLASDTQPGRLVIALPYTKTSKLDKESVVIRSRIVAACAAHLVSRLSPRDRIYSGSASKFRSTVK